MTTRLRLETLGAARLGGPNGEDLLGRRLTDLALVAVVADRAPASVRRDELLAMFWGERTEEKARHSLRQVVLRLRQVCGDAFEADATMLRLRRDTIDCDVQAFAAAATAGEWHAAIALWTGEFLPGCELVGAEGFRVWLDVERERLRRLLAHCYERASSELRARDDWATLDEYASRWVERFPLEEAAHLSYITALCKRGRVANAAAVRAAFVQRLRGEMDEAPSAEWMAATDGLLRDARANQTDSRAVEAAEVVEAPTPVVLHAARDNPTIVRRRRPSFALGAAAVVLATALIGARMAMARTDKPPALAIGEITSTLSPDSTRGFTTLLNIDLSRIRDLDVIGERRLSEITVARPASSPDAIARAAGAREVVEGMLSRRPNGTLRADLRRTDLSNGKTRAAYTLEASDLAELADLISEQIAHDFHVQVPVGRRDAVTSSILAYGFYEQGLRAYYEADDAAALRFFTAALAEDSTFAMAAFYKSRTVAIDSGDIYAARALRYAQQTNDRERLLITLAWGRRMQDPRVLAWAETLVTRYPSELDAHLTYASEMAGRWNLAEGLAHLRYVLEMDSANVGRSLRCRACAAASNMIEVYNRMDSTAAGERTARMWLRWQPTSVPAWRSYSVLLGDGKRYAEAHAAIDSAMKYSNDPGLALEHTNWWFKADDYAPIDEMWRQLETSTKPGLRVDALWTHMIASRTEGRMRDALDAAREFRRYSAESNHFTFPATAMPEAVVLFDMGRYREAAALFDSCARAERGVPPFASRLGAIRAWDWTHAATAYAAAGDTVALAWLEDSVRVNGALATERYQVLYHYVHGLRLEALHRPADAAAEFRAAAPGRDYAYVRIYVELARSLIAAGRPGEAIPLLLRTLAGPTSAAGLYATRSELHELLGQAYEQTQNPDGALAQYRIVVRAWRGADAAFTERREKLESRIAALSALRPVGQ